MMSSSGPMTGMNSGMGSMGLATYNPAVVADGVEVAFEPGLTGGEPFPAQRANEAGQQAETGLELLLANRG